MTTNMLHEINSGDSLLELVALCTIDSVRVCSANCTWIEPREFVVNV